MVSAPISGRTEALGAGEAGHILESATSAISWAAIIGGAFATAALSLILLALGSGFGLASVSPWPNSGASVTTFTAMTAIWLIIVQWVSSGLGGYLTGRLRTKWVGVHTHEVFFRDTANTAFWPGPSPRLSVPPCSPRGFTPRSIPATISSCIWDSVPAPGPRTRSTPSGTAWSCISGP